MGRDAKKRNHEMGEWGSFEREKLLFEIAFCFFKKKFIHETNMNKINIFQILKI